MGEPGRAAGGVEVGQRKRGRPRKGPAQVLVKPLLVDVGNGRRGKNSKPTRMGQQRLAVVSALYHAGFSYTDITNQTGLSYTQIRKDVATAEQQYQLSTRLANVTMRLDSEAVPLSVDHLIATLQSADPADTWRKDALAMRTLEGRGAFRAFRADDGTGRAPQTMALQVNFTAPAGLAGPAPSAQIVGVGRAALPVAAVVDTAPGPETPPPPAPRTPRARPEGYVD